jgi:hypothetical protein
LANIIAEAVRASLLVGGPVLSACGGATSSGGTMASSDAMAASEALPMIAGCQLSSTTPTGEINGGAKGGDA